MRLELCNRETHNDHNHNVTTRHMNDLFENCSDCASAVAVSSLRMHHERMTSAIAFNPELAGHTALATWNFVNVHSNPHNLSAVTLASLHALDLATRGNSTTHRVAMFCPNADRVVGSDRASGIDEILACPPHWRHAGSSDSGLISQHAARPPWLGRSEDERNATCFTVRAEQIRLHILRELGARGRAPSHGRARRPAWTAFVETDELWLSHPLGLFAQYELSECDLVLTVRAQQPHGPEIELYDINTGIMLARPMLAVVRLLERALMATTHLAGVNGCIGGQNQDALLFTLFFNFRCACLC